MSIRNERIYPRLAARHVVHIELYVSKEPGVASSNKHGHLIALCNDGTLWMKHIDKSEGWKQIDTDFDE